jgi:hypothetical protein
MSREEILDVLNRVYPQVIDYYGERSNQHPPQVEIHSSIYARVSGIPGMTGEEEPHAEIDREANKIFLYTPKLVDEEQIIRSIIHEYTHYLQNPGWQKRYYTMGKNYEDHPYEIEAHKSEEDWVKFSEDNVE